MTILKSLFRVSVLCAVGLSAAGCAQADREKAYAIGAGATDLGIVTGKITGENVTTACAIDDVNYGLLASGRSVTDTFSYTPADTAHTKLHVDGQKANPACTPPPPT